MCRNLALTVKQLRSINIKYAHSNATSRSNLLPLNFVPEEIKRLVSGEIKSEDENDEEEKQFNQVSDGDEGPKYVR